MKIEIHLSKDDLQEIIVNHLSNSGYDAKLDDVIFKVGTDTAGYGLKKHKVVAFNGVSVKCIPHYGR